MGKTIILEEDSEEGMEEWKNGMEWNTEGREGMDGKTRI